MNRQPPKKKKISRHSSPLPGVSEERIPDVRVGMGKRRSNASHRIPPFFSLEARWLERGRPGIRSISIRLINLGKWGDLAKKD